MTKRRNRRLRQEERCKRLREKGDYETLRSCAEKRRYPTHGDAISSALKNSQKFGTAYRIYKCEVCGGYHLTTHLEKEDYEEE